VDRLVMDFGPFIKKVIKKPKSYSSGMWAERADYTGQWKKMHKTGVIAQQKAVN